MALANSVAELLARFTNDTSLASIVTSVVACSLGLFYFAFYSRRATTNATWYALTSDALKSRSKQQEQWITNCQEVLYGGLKKVLHVWIGNMVYVLTILTGQKSHSNMVPYRTCCFHPKLIRA